MKALSKILFPKITWWLWLLVPLTFLGFYATYFSKFFTQLPSIFHIHAFCMMMWIALILVQPWLILKKKTKLHKTLGKFSYLLMPVVLLTAWLMIRHSYFKFITDETAKLAKEGKTIPTNEMIINAAEYMNIGVLYWLWLGIFYTLAIIHRKKMVAHASYMFAAILTLLGPTVDRILIPIYLSNNLSVNFFIVTFILIDLLLVALLFYQWKQGSAIKATLTSLVIYVLGQLIFFLLPRMYLWKVLIDPFG